MTIQEARVFVGRSLGFPMSFDGSVAAYAGLTAVQQVELTRAMISYIAANPDKFTPGQVATALAETDRAQRMGIETDDYDWGLFVDTALDRGAAFVSTTGFTLSTALVLAAVAFAVVAATNLTRSIPAK